MEISDEAEREMEQDMRIGAMCWLLGSVAEKLRREDESPVILAPAESTQVLE